LVMRDWFNNWRNGSRIGTTCTLGATKSNSTREAEGGTGVAVGALEAIGEARSISMQRRCFSVARLESARLALLE
jgi:hypothetical protein